jgi:GT2 family glycosyltransferase
MKTLAVILHYNTKHFTDRLYRQLKPYENQDYDLVILDNGSEIKPDNPSIRVDQNIFFGGGLNLAFQWVLDNPEYDSLLFLNSDLIIHGKDFVKTLRKELNEYKIISPSVIQPEEDQCYWPTMNSWYSKEIRQVPWVDFQCPLIHRDFIEHIKQYDDDLIYGWGNDVYSGYICNQNNWKIGVIDLATVVHLGSATIKETNSSNYNNLAEKGMYKYFGKINSLHILNEYRNLARNYNL